MPRVDITLKDGARVVSEQNWTTLVSQLKSAISSQMNETMQPSTPFEPNRVIVYRSKMKACGDAPDIFVGVAFTTGPGAGGLNPTYEQNESLRKRVEDLLSSSAQLAGLTSAVDVKPNHNASFNMPRRPIYSQ